jgi:hypothetical protein
MTTSTIVEKNKQLNISPMGLNEIINVVDEYKDKNDIEKKDMCI